MSINFLKSHPLPGVLDQQPTNKVHHLFRKIGREHQIQRQYLIISLNLVILRLEWSIARAQLKAQNPNTPNIHLLIVVIPNDYLRRHIIESPTESLSLTEIN